MFSAVYHVSFSTELTPQDKRKKDASRLIFRPNPYLSELISVISVGITCLCVI